MTYTTSTINRDFRIKVNGVNNEGNKINTLVGVSGCIDLIGEAMLEKFLDRAYTLTYAKKAVNDAQKCYDIAVKLWGETEQQDNN